MNIADIPFMLSTKAQEKIGCTEWAGGDKFLEGPKHTGPMGSVWSG